MSAAEWRTRGARTASGVLDQVTGRALGPYQTAIVRIGLAGTWLFFLLREWPHRQELYGPEGPWSWSMADRLIDSNQAFSVLMWSDADGWFQFVYLLAVAASAALLLGWHTRAASVLFMVGVLALQNRSVFMGDGGDNVIHLMAIYLVFTRCGQVWSLDARRAARARARGEGEHGAAGGGLGGAVVWALLGVALAACTVTGGFALGWGIVFWVLWIAHGVWGHLDRAVAAGRAGQGVRETRTVCDIVANLVHNGALLIIMVEVCLIYSTAGWYKIQGTRWQDGTAVYYPLHLDYFSPWPALSDALSGNGIMIFLISYGTVAVQVAFPFTLFNRRVKNVLLALMITEHVSIAVILGLPVFSAAMITADAVFLPTVFLVWAGRHVGGTARRVLPGSRRRAPAAARDGDGDGDGGED
ncbi:HTTM domain-containing protein, partial [Streptomyces boncukensis]|uniref:HTTM domain-containing protein n=1 Tax=Streptomyces boncukensis TaxID=2711219 RepID=UPI0019D05311